MRAQAALQAGVTTVRCVEELNRADLLLREAGQQGWVKVPRIFGAGRGLSTPDGHGRGGGCHYVRGAEGFADAARQEMQAGADHLKIYVTGGLAHAGESTAIRQALDLGVRTFEHGYDIDAPTQPPCGTPARTWCRRCA